MSTLYEEKAPAKDEKEKGKKEEKPTIASGEVTTDPFEFNPADVITAECTIGDPPPAEASATLELTTDAQAWTPASRKAFHSAPAPEAKYSVAWVLSEFATGGWKGGRVKLKGGAGMSVSVESALDAGKYEPETEPKKKTGEHHAGGHGPSGGHK
jgi:hypothetical protein